MRGEGKKLLSRGEAPGEQKGEGRKARRKVVGGVRLWYEPRLSHYYQGQREPALGYNCNYSIGVPRAGQNEWLLHLGWVLGEVSLQKGLCSVGTGCPGKWGSRLPWRASRDMEMQNFVMWLSGGLQYHVKRWPGWPGRSPRIHLSDSVALLIAHSCVGSPLSHTRSVVITDTFLSALRAWELRCKPAGGSIQSLQRT